MDKRERNWDKSISGKIADVFVSFIILYSCLFCLIFHFLLSDRARFHNFPSLWHTNSEHVSYIKIYNTQITSW